MHPFASYVLRSYYQATGWNEDNLYANLTRSSNALLDFAVPKGLHLSVSKSTNELFRTSYSMNAMPSLNGSIGYIFTSCSLDTKSSGFVRFKDMIERFKVYDQPHRPEDKEEVWLAGKRVDTRDYLLYGRFYLPTGRLDAMYSTRISPTLQAVVAAISDPRASLLAARGIRSINPNNLMLSLQHDVGRWCTEYTLTAEDNTLGARFLYNFGKMNSSLETPEQRADAAKKRQKLVDEDDDSMEGGLRGRISAGAEVYFSAKEKSGGVSTGIRFTTLPDATPPSFQLPSPASSPLSAFSHKTAPSQPPTTITALYNPMMGHISAAYATKVSRDLSMASRFDFNVYSYDSEWTVGAEWWIRRNHSHTSDDPNESAPPPPNPVQSWDDAHGVVKARASTNNDVSLMWEGRLRSMLLSLGVVSNFSNRSKPIKAIGLELSYFSDS